MLAGPTRSTILDTYVRGPINQLIAEANDVLPDMVVRMDHNGISLIIRDEVLYIARRPMPGGQQTSGDIPDDVSDDLPV